MSELFEDRHFGVKKLSINGKVEKNLDCGIGYTICWEDEPFQASNEKNQRYGAYLQDIICRCIDQVDFIKKTTPHASDKYDIVKNKLMQALNQLKNISEDVVEK